MTIKTRLLLTIMFVWLCTETARSQGDSLPFKTRKSVSLSTGIEMHYREAGSGNDVLIMLHGYTDSGRSFEPTIDSLRACFPGLHILAPDLRGHGRSSMPAAEQCAGNPGSCFEIADFTADIIAFMDACNVRQAHLAGHSLGSLVAQEVALAHPARIRSLTLIGTAASVKNNHVVEGFLFPAVAQWQQMLTARKGFRWPADAYLLTPLDADPNAETWMAANWVADPTAAPAFINMMVPETARVPIGTWYGVLKTVREFDYTRRLAGLTMPTFVLWATQDDVFTEDPDQRRLRASLDEAVRKNHINYHFKVYGKKPLPPSGDQEDDLGHNLQWGAPQAVARDLAAFIRTGKPSADLYYADTRRPGQLVVEKGRATVITGASSLD